MLSQDAVYLAGIAFAIGVVFGVIVFALAMYALVWWQDEEVPQSSHDAWIDYCKAMEREQRDRQQLRTIQQLDLQKKNDASA